MEKTCKIILVDDHSLFRNGLRGLLAAHPGYEVVGEAASGEEFLAMLPALAADVAFMDIAMPGMAGDEATVQALGLQPDLKIITLSMYGEEVYYTRMMTAGAKGFLLKDSDFSEVIEAIDTVSAGGSYICRDGGCGRQLFFAAAALVAHGTHAHAGRRRGRTAVVART